MRLLLTLLSSLQPRMTDSDNHVEPSWRGGWKEKKGRAQLEGPYGGVWSNLLLFVSIIKIIPLNAILPYYKRPILRK